MFRSKIYLLFAFCFLLLPAAKSQTTLQVVTKKIEKTFAYHIGYEVNIEGENAEVLVESWDKNEIQIIVELSSKHPEKETAKADLEKVKYFAKKVKRKIYARNYLASGEDIAPPKSKINAKYTVHLPKECPVYLKNHFGFANFINLENRLRVNGEFSNIELQNISGYIDVTSRFGDLLGVHLDGDVSIDARRSNVTLREIAGRYDIKSHYGILEIFGSEDLLELKIDANKSDVHLFDINPKLYAYSIEAKNSEINLPQELSFQVSEDAVGLKKATFKPKEEFFANIIIGIRFGELIIDKKPRKVRP